MMTLLVATAMVLQIGPSNIDAARTDLAFTRSVEEFVIAAAPGHQPPEPFRSFLVQLGAPSWREREVASRELQGASAMDQRWLFWGRRNSDLEVRLRSNAVLRRLNPCTTCKGSGNSKNWELWPCWDCQGTATAWPWSMWD
jgi:hypothetical protein